MELSGQHAVVTGGGRGIGLVVAETLTKAGAAVTILGRDAKTLGKAVAAGKAAGHELADVTRPGEITSALKAAAAARGDIAILVNNAGGVESTPFADVTRASWEQLLTLNLTATFEGCHAVIAGMAARKYGRIVNIASTAGLKGYRYVAAYCAAKHGVIGLTRALAHEYARTGVTVNAVCPGYTETELVAQSVERVAAKTGKSPDEIRGQYARANPMGRLMTPVEVAAAVLFLCRPGAAAMTGQSIVVAGGEIM